MKTSTWEELKYEGVSQSLIDVQMKIHPDPYPDSARSTPAISTYIVLRSMLACG